jgi:TATA-box binding protein (TBP) (component of TFIID and TFIIIB)
MCNGKGNGDGDGKCKKVTIAVFKSGKIIITGGQNKSQLEDSYEFIKDFIEDKKDYYSIEYK